MLRQDAYQKFRDCILSGDLKPGQFVTQKELCDLFGVPLGPAREAIQRLEYETLLKVYPKRGIQICDVSPRLIRNAFQFRCIIEKEGVRAYVNTASRDAIVALRDRTVALLEHADKEGVTAAITQSHYVLNSDFHNALVDSLDNDLLLTAYHINEARIRLIRLGNRETGDQIIPAQREHLRILQACVERDAVQAVQLLEEHILAAQRRALDGC